MTRNLESLPDGKSALVVRVRGGHGVASKLEAMGLRPGKRVRKVSAQFMAGPVTVVLDGRELAMGRGIARHVQVEDGA